MEGQAQMATPPPAKKGGKGGLILGIINLLLVLGVGIGLVVVAFIALSSDGSSDGGSIFSGTESSDSGGTMLNELYKKVSPSVVYLYNSDVELQVDDFGQIGFGNTGSLGSGVVYDSEGYIVTNAHVVADQLGTRINRSVEVVFPDTGDNYVAKVIAADALNDIAIVKIQERGLPTSEFGNIDDVEVGDTVFAVGSPGGSNSIIGNLQNTMTAGIVSGKDRSFGIIGLLEGIYYGGQIPETIPSLAHNDLIQIDAAVNHGNSGGPLYNDKGEVIGINTLVERGNNQQGLSFAVPVDTVQRIAEDAKNEGKLTAPYVGIASLPVDRVTAKIYNFKANEGALVYLVLPNSPAIEADVRPFDIITSVNGTAVSSASEYEEELLKVDAGDEVTLEINRDGARNTVKVKTIETPFLQGL